MNNGRCRAEIYDDLRAKLKAGEPITSADYRETASAKGHYPKEVTLAYWHGLTPNAPILPHMAPIPSKASGRSYGACGVRIDGNPEFIDAVLSRLKDLIEGESGSTRLELSRAQVRDVEIKGETKRFNKAGSDAEVCYIRLHERGPEAKICNAVYGRQEGLGI